MGRYKAGRITEDQFYEIECKACGGPGACTFMGTANTMNCIVEALGLALPGCATLRRSIPTGPTCAAPAAGASSNSCAKVCMPGPC